MKKISPSLTLEQKIGQLFLIGIAGAEVDVPTRDLLDEISPGGICLFARNIREATQTHDLLTSIRELSPIEPFLSIDQEGGLVDRLRRIVTPMPAASKIKTVAEAEELARIIAEVLRILGFNMNFAPVVDVTDDERAKYSNGLSSRTFGHSKEDVAEFAGAFLGSLQSGGLIGCLKHFPGLAAAQVDSHEELPIVNISEERLSEIDLQPYRELFKSSNVHAVMVAHATFPQHHLQETGQNGKLLPSSLSYNFVTTLLRDQLAFDGIVITDDLEMGAIVKNHGIGEACKLAVNAGSDMLAICANPHAVREGYNAVLAAVNSGEIQLDRIEISLERIVRLKDQLQEPLKFDTERLDQLSTEIAGFNDRLSL